VKQDLRDRLAGLAIGSMLVVAAACSDDSGADGADREADPASDATKEPAEWLHLGRDLAHTRAATDETIVGPENVDGLQPVWELSDVTGVTGTPIIADGVVYIGDWNGDLWALDAATGEEIWSRGLDTSRIQAAVAIDDDHVFVGAFDPRIVALDRDTGEEVWQATVDDHPMASIFGSPMYVDGLVIVGVASYENVAGVQEFSFRGSVVALDAATGDEVWRYWTTEGDETEGPGVSVWSTPAVDLDREHVYVGTGQHYAEPTADRSDAIIALDLTTGEEQWVYQYTAGDVWVIAEPGEGLDADIGAPPNLFTVGDTDAVGAGDKDGVYKALDRDTGEVLWSTDLTEGGLQGGVMASAAVHDGSVYVMSNEASTTSELFALDQDTGEIRWQAAVGSLAVGPVTWANGVVYVTDNTGNISGFDADSGERLWAYQTEGEAAGGIAVVDGTMYAGYGWWLFGAPDEPKGGLVAFRLDDTDEVDGAPAPAEAASGADVYRQSCATCHGADGAGGQAPSLVDVDDRLTVDESVEIVREGRGAMPAWEDTLSPEAIDAVVHYVHSELSDNS
jgi:polyvinyl alcohol dehydrogenase (cytochrome)